MIKKLSKKRKTELQDLVNSDTKTCALPNKLTLKTGHIIKSYHFGQINKRSLEKEQES